MSINQLPLYKSHKTVGAARITAFRQNGIPDAPDLVLGEIGSITTMLPEWHEKHKPYVGGYLVKYDDSYMSFSPAKAFEDGYRLVDTPAATQVAHVGMTIAGNGAAMLGALMREQYANRGSAFKAVPAPIVVQPDALHAAVRSVCGQAGEAPEQFIEWLGKGGFAEMALCYFTRDKGAAVQSAPLTDAQWGNLLDSIDEIATQEGNGPLSEKALDRIKRSIVFYGLGISAPVVPTPTQTREDAK